MLIAEIPPHSLPFTIEQFRVPVILPLLIPATPPQTSALRIELRSDALIFKFLIKIVPDTAFIPLTQWSITPSFTAAIPPPVFALPLKSQS